MYLPAVDLNGQGILTNVTVQAIAGSGRIFIDVKPYFSIDTQQSVKRAVEQGAALANKNLSNFDVLVQINTDAQSVDGPSGGAAITLLTYAELSGKSIRSDFSMTGTINADDSIGQVGGILQKAQAAASNGIKVFLVPSGQSFQNGTDLTVYGPSHWGMQVLEVTNMSQVIAIAFTPTGSAVNVQPKQIQAPVKLMNITPDNQSSLLTSFVYSTINESMSELNTLNSTGNLSAGDLNNFYSSLNDSSQLLNEGYIYSAANEAFLTKIQIEYVNFANLSQSQMLTDDQDLLNQANNMQSPTKTLSNFEWVATGDLRYYWAINQLNLVKKDLESGSPNLPSDGYELAIASNWLSASNQLWQIGNITADNQSPINELLVRNFAANEIKQAQNAVNASTNPSSDAISHIQTAYLEYSSGAYIAASLDAAYAYAVEASNDNFDSQFPQYAINQVGNYSQIQNYTNSVWARLYFVHALYYAQYYNATSDPSTASNALELRYLADTFEQVVSEIPTVLASTSIVSPTSLNNNTASMAYQMNVNNAQNNWGNLNYNGQMNLLVLLIIAAGASILLVAYLTTKRNRDNKKLSNSVNYNFADKSEFDSLDKALIEGRISERTYLSLKAKSKVKPTVASKQQKIQKTMKENKN